MYMYACKRKFSAFDNGNVISVRIIIHVVAPSSEELHTYEYQKKFDTNHGL